MHSHSILKTRELKSGRRDDYNEKAFFVIALIILPASVTLLPPQTMKFPLGQVPADKVISNREAEAMTLVICVQQFRSLSPL